MLKKIVKTTIEPLNVIQQSRYENTLKTSDSFGSIRHVSPKVAEVERQVERLRSIQHLSKDVESIDLCIALLHRMASAPVPSPISGWSEGNGPSLFFEEDGYYVDIEISEGAAEYYLKSRSAEKELEVYNIEKIEHDYAIPEKLLTYLYVMFARQHGNVS